MEFQTVLLWVARLACPITLAVVLWLLPRSGQPIAEPEPSAAQRLTELRNRRAVLVLEIQALGAQVAEEAPTAKVPLLEEEPSTP